MVNNICTKDKRLVFAKGKQAELINYFLNKYGLSLRQLGVFLGVSKSTICDYLSERTNIRQSTFQKLCEFDEKANEFNAFIEKRLPLNWGASKGGVSRESLIVDKSAFYARLRKIKAAKEEKFSGITKQTIEKHPLIERLVKENVDLYCILGVCLLTDGSLCVKDNNHRISYYTTDANLEKILLSLLNKLSSNIPKVAYTKKGNVVRVSDVVLGKHMLSLSPNYKTSPSWKYQTKEDYLSESQPTLKFLSNCNEQTKVWILRFGFSADGSISLPQKSKPSLDLACYHPTLVLEWKDFLESLGFKCHLVKNKNSWCGLSGIRMQSLSSIKKFYNLGGFIDGVKISRKSRRFCNIPKNALLEHVVKSGQGGI